ncbi:MAG: DoxX family protein [Kutzneria sp.]|nr:DoxX family protein [Kutzneria sp.]MBV9844731.1 DoxX family protein [Kutzneria sp.]
MAMSTTKTIIFWTATGIIAATWLGGGVADLIRWPDTVADMLQLGYPPYVMTILGMWKIPAAIVILMPGYPLLKEWAYAGTFFEISGAFASHLAAGSAFHHLFWTGLFTVCTVVSWALRPRSRTLGALIPSRTWAPAAGTAASSR